MQDSSSHSSSSKATVTAAAAAAAMGPRRWIPKDFGSICLLLVLYTLQGIPMGLDGSLPLLLLQKISYKQQSLLSLTSLPFSLKLLWAPVVDGCYFRCLGRRRSWLIPLQFAAGFLMIWAAKDKDKLQAWMGDTPGGDGQPNVVMLSAFFGFLYFLMATQDIAVDGWALTLLSPENKGLASTCNTVGQTLGYCFSYVGFLALNDANFSKKFLKVQREGKGAVDLSDFIAFWGWVFVVTTTIVLLFFKETEGGLSEGPPGGPPGSAKGGPPHVEATTYAGPISGGEEMHFFADDVLAAVADERGEESAGVEAEESCEPKGVVESYCLLWRLLYLAPIQSLLPILLTVRVGFAAVDAATQLKIIERGVPKEQLAFFAPLLMPFGIICPFLVSKWLTGSAPLRLFMYGHLMRLAFCCVWAGIVALTPFLYGSSFSYLFYLFLFVVTSLYSVCSDLMFVSMMAFFARVSDPRIGGSYMTFLNTMSNIGSQWPRALSLWLMDSFAIKDCTGVDLSVPEAKCPVVLDGYFVQVGACVVLGLCWAAIFRPRVQQLQQVPLRCWRVSLPQQQQQLAAAAAETEMKPTEASSSSNSCSSGDDDSSRSSSDSSNNSKRAAAKKQS